jgi:hypothetical protein
MSPRDLKRLRRSPHEEVTSWLASVAGTRFVFQGILSRGASADVAVHLSANPSVSAAFFSTIYGLALHWIAFGGLASAKATAFTNDLHDIDYAVLGSLSVDLLSDDCRLNAIHRAVREASHARTSWFRRALTFGIDRP